MIRMQIAIAGLALLPLDGLAQEAIPATLFKSPGCACCDKYADYLNANGFRVTVIEHPNISSIKRKYGVSEALEGCHTTIIDGYAVEGHVPQAVLKRLLLQKPALRGISLPGMPQGSPGMSGTKNAPFEILSITDEESPASVYATD
jgi:hypothetical protein